MKQHNDRCAKSWCLVRFCPGFTTPCVCSREQNQLRLRVPSMIACPKRRILSPLRSVMVFSGMSLAAVLALTAVARFDFGRPRTHRWHLDGSSCPLPAVAGHLRASSEHDPTSGNGGQQRCVKVAVGVLWNIGLCWRWWSLWPFLNERVSWCMLRGSRRRIFQDSWSI